MGQIICSRCGQVFKCIQGATIHVMINHLYNDIALLPETFDQKCYDCLWGMTVPFKVATMDGKNVRLGILPHGARLQLPY